MTPTPLPSPNQAKSTAKTAPPQPAPTVTVTGTVTVIQEPDPVPLEDQLQGWGSAAAVLVALLIAVTGWNVERRRRKADKKAGDEDRQQDREDADRRLRDERAAADRRLQQQLREQRERDRRAFVVAQLQGAGDLYAEQMGMRRNMNDIRFLRQDDPGRIYGERVAVQRLRSYLPAIPPPYVSLMKVAVFGSHSPMLDKATLAEARRRTPAEDSDAMGDIDTEEIFREVADNIAELLGVPGTEAGGDLVNPTGATAVPSE